MEIRRNRMWSESEQNYQIAQPTDGTHATRLGWSERVGLLEMMDKSTSAAKANTRGLDTQEQDTDTDGRGKEILDHFRTIPRDSTPRRDLAEIVICCYIYVCIFVDCIMSVMDLNGPLTEVH